MIAASAAIALAGSVVVFADEAKINREVVLLGDVADLSPLPEALQAKAAAVPLLKLARSASATVPLRQLASRARAAMPVLAHWLPPEQPGAIRLHRSIPAGLPVVVAAGVRKGQVVVVRIETAAFAIERQGTALSDAEPGGRLFVRTADGEAIVVRCREDQP